MCCKYKGLMKDRWKYWRNSSIAKVSVIEHGLRESDVGHVWNFNIRIHNSKKKKFCLICKQRSLIGLLSMNSNPTFLTDITNVSTCISLINVTWEREIRFLSMKKVDEKRIVDSRFPFPDVDLHLPFSVGKQKKMQIHSSTALKTRVDSCLPFPRLGNRTRQIHIFHPLINNS